MDPALHCDYCHGLGQDARGDWIDCTLDAPADPSIDTECAVCYDSFTDQRTVRHDFCRHVFHLECINMWAPQLTEDDDLDGPQTISCPMCRQPTRHINIGPYPKRVLRIAPPNLSHILLASIRQKPVYPTQRRTLMYVVDQNGHRFPDAHRFYQQRICPRDRTIEYPQHAIAPGRRPYGSQIFEGMDTVQGGALETLACPHVREYFLLDPERYYHIVSELFSNGWNPADGTQVGRAAPGSPSWLPDLIALATNNHMHTTSADPWIEISHVEFASAFHNSQAIKFGSRVIIQMVPSQDELGKWRGFVAGFRQTGPERDWHLLDHTATMGLIDGMGGLDGTNLTLDAFDPEDMQSINRVYSARYGAIHTRFPIDFRPEDDL